MLRDCWFPTRVPFFQHFFHSLLIIRDVIGDGERLNERVITVGIGF